MITVPTFLSDERIGRQTNITARTGPLTPRKFEWRVVRLISTVRRFWADDGQPGTNSALSGYSQCATCRGKTAVADVPSEERSSVRDLVCHCRAITGERRQVGGHADDFKNGPAHESDNPDRLLA